MNPLFVQWGGGNIGRSFIGQVFSLSGYNVKFIDIDKDLITSLNKMSEYIVKAVSGDTVQDIHVTRVSAIDAKDQNKVNEAIVNARLMGVSVGRGVWPHIAKSLATSILARYTITPDEPLDIILAENIHRASAFVTSLLIPHLPDDFPIDTYVGLVETSIGKMVPIQEKNNSLTLIAEPYNELIVDEKGFLQSIPEVKALHPVTPIGSYVDRKLFIHNLGHATSAYLGYMAHPEKPLIAEVLEDEKVTSLVRLAMMQSSEVLLSLYPDVFTQTDLIEHIDDLLHRFTNKALGDTVYRVGRDLMRKLRYDDRLMGIIIEAQKIGKPYDHIARAYLAAFSFKATDVNNEMFVNDKKLHLSLENLSLREKLYTVSGWQESGLSIELFNAIAERFEKIAKSIEGIN